LTFLLLFFFTYKHKAAGFIHCNKHGMTATASNRSQMCSGGLLKTAEKKCGFSRFAGH